MSDGPATIDAWKDRFLDPCTKEVPARWDMSVGDVSMMSGSSTGKWMRSEDVIGKLNHLWDEIAESRRTINALSETNDALDEMIVNLRKELHETRLQRDHARRRVCEMSIQLGGIFRRVGGKTVECTTSHEVAEMLGWDCYREDRDEAQSH